VSLVFKRCELKDLDLLIKISKDTFIAAFESANDPKDFYTYINDAFSETSITRQLLNSNCLFYFIYHENILIAYVKLNENEAQNEQFESPSIELERIYVLPEFIGQGYGNKILNKIKSICLAKKVDFLWLGVWENNTDAIRFYERHGFKKFGEHPYYLGKDKQTDWLMKFEF